MRIPAWLTHLRRDHRGIPVPYVNLWGAEDLSRISMRHDPHVNALAVYLDDTHEVLPDFTRQNMQRQRECMALGRCQVCAHDIPWSRRTVVVGSNSVEWIDLNGRQTPVVNEPWTCRRCALFATSHCPALIRRQRTDKLQLVHVQRPADCRLVVSRGWVEGPLEQQSRELQPVMWAKLLLLNVRIDVAA